MISAPEVEAEAAHRFVEVRARLIAAMSARIMPCVHQAARQDAWGFARQVAIQVVITQQNLTDNDKGK